MIIFMLRFYLLPLIIYILFCILYLDLISNKWFDRKHKPKRETFSERKCNELSVCLLRSRWPNLQQTKRPPDPPKPSTHKPSFCDKLSGSSQEIPTRERGHDWEKNCSHRARKWQPSITQSVSGTKYFSRTVHTMERCFSRETFWGKTSLHLVSC